MLCVETGGNVERALRDASMPFSRKPPDISNAANQELTPEMRLLELQRQHRALDQKILELQANPYQNQILLQRLKKEKLRLKDRIEQLKDDLIPDLDA